MNLESKYKGSIQLSAIGDALGWITEFENSVESLRTKYGTGYIEIFHNWEKKVGGRFNGYVDKIEAGSYSDDTQLLLSVARSINPNGFVDQQYFAKKELPEWLIYSRGAGRTIKNAARKIGRKSASWNKNFFTFKVGKSTIDYRQCGGNGAAMRILPIALANFGNTDKILQEAFGNSLVTHGHPRAILGAMLYGYSVNTILRCDPCNFDPALFLTDIGKDFHRKYSIDFLSKPKYSIWENEWNRSSKIPFRDLFGDILDETLELLRLTYKVLSNSCSDHEALRKLGCYNSQTKGSGISTVIAGVYFACKYAKQPVEGIKKAVNCIGSDTDSIAAFTGGLLGALHGNTIIPSQWKKVQDFDYLGQMSSRLVEINQNRFSFVGLPASSIYTSFSDIAFSKIQSNDKIYLETLSLGTVTKVERQKSPVNEKYTLILDVQFENGQFCRFAKLLRV